MDLPSQRSERSAKGVSQKLKLPEKASISLNSTLRIPFVTGSAKRLNAQDRLIADKNFLKSLVPHPCGVSQAREATNPKRADSEPLAAPQVLADHFPLPAHHQSNQRLCRNQRQCHSDP
jgi:hypothetical protein